LKYIIQHFGTLKDSFQTIIKVLYTLAPISLIYFYKKIPIYSYIKLNYHWVAFIISVLIAGLFLSSRLLRPWVILTPVIFYTVYSLKSKEIIKNTSNQD
jgi:formate-dependent nitrite reductase membrane component NrfD